MTAAPDEVWRRVCNVAALAAVDPGLGGVCVRARAGPVRDVWLDHLRACLPAEAPMRRVPASVTDDRLLGGMDLTATLRAGRPIAKAGLLDEAQGGVLVLAMAERLSAATAARITSVMDAGEMSAERDGFSFKSSTRFTCIALDEGLDDGESPPTLLKDRLAFWIELDEIPPADLARREITTPALDAARACCPTVTSTAADVEALVTAAAHLGVDSLRAIQMSLRAARAACALRGGYAVNEADLRVAAGTVLAPRATQTPQAPAEAQPQPQQNDTRAQEHDRETSETAEPGEETTMPDLNDIVLAAAAASIPPGLLSRIKNGFASKARVERSGKSGGNITHGKRGRPLAARQGALRDGRLGLIETLRAAAPWQPMRRRKAAQDGSRRLIIHLDDFRIKRSVERRETSAIFVVDASGSSAMHRLAEVKGAIELLLAECYSRRDNVALVAFRDRSGEIVLPPTRSLARAKRLLAGLPGGGGTPIAAGLDTALTLADSVRRKGQSPLLILMTDGRANIGRDGSPGRARAFEDALDAGRRVRAAGVAAIAIDTARPGPCPDMAPTQQLGQAMNARYLKLPYANAAHVSEIVRAAAVSA